MKYRTLPHALFGLALTLSAWHASAQTAMPDAAENALRVTLLGTGNPVPRIARAGNSTLVEAGKQKLVFDFGRNASTRLWQVGIPLGRIDAFFLTHFHSDHTIGFPDLWLTGWLQPAYGRRAVPLELHGPTGTVEFAAGLRQAFASDIGTRQKDEGTPLNGVTINVHDDAPGLVYAKDGVKVFAFNNDHGVNIKPSFGYRIEYRGRSVVISGDTRYSTEVVKQATHADILVHCISITSEAQMKANPGYRAIAAHLSSPDDVARVLNVARPKLAIFSHIGLNGDVTTGDIVRQVGAKYDGNFVVGEDLMRFEISTQSEHNGIRMWQVENK